RPLLPGLRARRTAAALHAIGRPAKPGRAPERRPGGEELPRVRAASHAGAAPRGGDRPLVRAALRRSRDRGRAGGPPRARGPPRPRGRDRPGRGGRARRPRGVVSGLPFVAIAGFLAAGLLATLRGRALAARIAAGTSALVLLPQVDVASAWPALALAAGAA